MDAQESTFFKGLFKQMTTTVKHFCFSNDLQVNMCVRLMDSGRAPKEKNSSQFASLVMDAFIKDSQLTQSRWGITGRQEAQRLA